MSDLASARRIAPERRVGADLRLLTDRWIAPDRWRRVGELIVVLWALSLCDLTFTLWAHAFTPFRELNPLAAALLRAELIGPLVGFKLALTGAGTAIFWHLRHDIRAEAALWGLVAVYVMLTVRWGDYWVAALA